jgi:hypothetical protein
MSNPFIGKHESEESEDGQVHLFVDCPKLIGSPLDSFLFLNSDLITEGQWVALSKDPFAFARVLAQGNLQLV